MANAGKGSPAAAYRKVLLEHEDPLDDPNDAEFIGATLSINPDREHSPTPASANVRQDSTIADRNANLETDGRIMANHASANNSGKWQQQQQNANSVNNAARMEGNFESARNYFAVRSGAFDQAVEACRPITLENIDGQFKGAWLLTEIDHWDNEKERLVFLLDRSIIIIKFDFITIRILDYRRIPVTDLDRVTYGQITYPQNSLMPKLNGAAGHVKQFVTSRLQRHNSTTEPPSSSANPSQISGFESRPKNSLGVRAMWNKGQPLEFSKNWNPWSREIPYTTLTAHRLFHGASSSGDDSKNYSIDDFKDKFLHTIQTMGPPNCLVKEEPIVIENYVGLVSVFHNITDLGFFKARGRVSF